MTVYRFVYLNGSFFFFEDILTDIKLKIMSMDSLNGIEFIGAHIKVPCKIHILVEGTRVQRES